jgi:hypothetical protein
LTEQGSLFRFYVGNPNGPLVRVTDIKPKQASASGPLGKILAPTYLVGSQNILILSNVRWLTYAVNQHADRSRKMALLKRELYRQVKGPEITHADRCTLVFDTDIKSLYVEREVAHLEADIGGTIDYQTATMDIADYPSKAVKLPGTVSYGGY